MRASKCFNREVNANDVFLKKVNLVGLCRCAEKHWKSKADEYYSRSSEDNEV